jgi:exodeoxyribonuclease X
MTVRVIDIETTGIDPTIDAVIEIASVDLLKDGTIANQRSTLVRPAVPVPPESSAVHHLIDEDLAGAPPLMDVVHLFRGADAFVAHNADFERSFLGPVLGNPTFVCTYKAALRIWPGLPSHSNQALRYRLGHVHPFGIDRHTLSPHRALSDAIVTAAVLAEEMEHASWPELVQWSAEPALLSVLRFGKHRGERFDEAPADYLDWLANGRHDMGEAVRFSARHWLEKQTARTPEDVPA